MDNFFKKRKLCKKKWKYVKKLKLNDVKVR